MRVNTLVSNIYSAFTQIAIMYPTTKAILYKENDAWQSITYKELHERVQRFSRYLKKQYTIEPGTKIALMLDNHPDYAIFFFSTLALGGTVVTLDVQYPAEQIKNILVHSESKFIILSDQYFQRIKKLIPKNVEVIISDDEEYRAKWMAMSSKEVSLKKPRGPDPLTALLYTSGTTDNPKGVMLSNKNLLSNINAISSINIVRHKDVVISMLPLHHAYALTSTLLVPLLTGATIAYPPGITSVDLITTMRETRTDIFVGVPQVFNLIHRSINDKLANLKGIKKFVLTTLERFNLFLRKYLGINMGPYFFGQMHKIFGNHVRYMISGGAKLDPEVAWAFYRWGFTLLEGYGLTETSPVVSFNMPQRFKIGTVGVSLPGVHVEIFRPNKEGIGELAVKGPNVMKGYYKQPDKTKEVIQEGWFFTGDLAFIDTEGFINITGRKKELIVLSSGKNINPEEIEGIYSKNPFIKEIGVLTAAVSTALGSADQLVAIVVTNDDYFKAKHETNIRNRLTYEIETISNTLPSYKTIKGFVITPEPLPRTRLGKLMRYQLPEIFDRLNKKQKKQIQEESDTVDQEQAAELAQRSDLVKKAIAFFEETLKRKVKLSDHLELDLGLDSLGRIEILLNLQTILNLELDDNTSMDFFMCHTIEELADKLETFSPSDPEQKAGSPPGPQRAKETWDQMLQEDLSEVTKALIKIEQSFAAKALTFISQLFLIILFKILFRLKVEGQENLKTTGPYIVCPTHSSYLDGPLIFAALPYKVLLNSYILGLKEVLDQCMMGPFYTQLRMIPIEHNYTLVESLKMCAYVLRNNKILCFFPEGGRSLDGEVKEFKKGIGILMKELSPQIIPTYIQGAYDAWPRQRKWPRPGKITIHFGPVLKSEDIVLEKDMDEDPYEILSQHLRAEVIKLKESKD